MEVHDNVELFGRESGFASPAMKVEPEVRPPGLPRPLASSLCRRISSVKVCRSKASLHQPPYVALATTCSGAGGHGAFATHPEVCARGGPCLLPFSAAHAHLVTRVPHAKRKPSRAPYRRRAVRQARGLRNRQLAPTSHARALKLLARSRFMQVSSLLEAKFAELLERLPLQASRGSLDGTAARGGEHSRPALWVVVRKLLQARPHATLVRIHALSAAVQAPSAEKVATSHAAAAVAPVSDGGLDFARTVSRTVARNAPLLPDHELVRTQQSEQTNQHNAGPVPPPAAQTNQHKAGPVPPPAAASAPSALPGRSLCGARLTGAASAPGLGSPLPASAPGLGWARPCHICAGAELTPAHICTGTGLGSPLPHLRRDWARRCHICAGTGLAAVTSAPGLGSPLSHSRAVVASVGPFRC
jgi:hypothetical protein